MIKKYFFIILSCLSLTFCSQSHPGIEIGNPTSNPPPTPTVPAALVGVVLTLSPTNGGESFYQVRFISSTLVEVSVLSGTLSNSEIIQTATGEIRTENNTLVIDSIINQPSTRQLSIRIENPTSPSRTTQLSIEDTVVESQAVYRADVYTATPMVRMAQSIYGVNSGDFDGDGQTDIAFFQFRTLTQPEINREFAIIYGNNSGLPTSVASEPIVFDDESHGAIWVQGSVSDVDHDGMSDVILFYQTASDPSYLAIRYGSHDRSFSRREEIAVSGVSDSFPAILLALGDIYGNSALDYLVIRHSDVETCPDPILGCSYSVLPLALPSGVTQDQTQISGFFGYTPHFLGKEEALITDLDQDHLKEIVFMTIENDGANAVINIFNLSADTRSGNAQFVTLPPSGLESISPTFLFQDVISTSQPDLLYVQSSYTNQTDLLALPGISAKEFNSTQATLLNILGGFWTPITMRSLDLNGDHKNDLVLIDQSGNVQMLLHR